MNPTDPTTKETSPSWENLVPAMLTVLENPNANHMAKQRIRESFLHIAKNADRYSETIFQMLRQPANQ
jgi:hypothetical protein